jgi:hypothetical protein
MSRIKRMSPALIVAILALIAALIVPAVAQVATKALTKREVFVVRKVSAFQANRLINRRVPRIARFQANRLIAAQVHTPSRFVVNDPSSGDTAPQATNLLSAGPFTIRARCFANYDNSGQDRAFLDLIRAGASFSGARTDGGYSNFPDITLDSPIVGAVDSANVVRSGDFIAVAPNGQVLKVTGSAEVGDPAGDCVFGVTAIGP